MTSRTLNWHARFAGHSLNIIMVHCIDAVFPCILLAGLVLAPMMIIVARAICSIHAPTVRMHASVFDTFACAWVCAREVCPCVCVCVCARSCTEVDPRPLEGTAVHPPLIPNHAPQRPLKKMDPLTRKRSPLVSHTHIAKPAPARQA